MIKVIVNEYKEINIVSVPLLLSFVSTSKLSSYDSSKSNIGWFVNDVSTTIFKSGKGVISKFKSMSHGVNLTLVEAIVEAVILIKEAGGKLIFS
jgi:hypothetical protein